MTLKLIEGGDPAMPNELTPEQRAQLKNDVVPWLELMIQESHFHLALKRMVITIASEPDYDAAELFDWLLDAEIALEVGMKRWRQRCLEGLCEQYERQTGTTLGAEEFVRRMRIRRRLKAMKDNAER